jgi:hypothetical protein
VEYLRDGVLLGSNCFFLDGFEALGSRFFSIKNYIRKQQCAQLWYRSYNLTSFAKRVDSVGSIIDIKCNVFLRV